jgi:hypothetical protein
MTAETSQRPPSANRGRTTRKGADAAAEPADGRNAGADQTSDEDRPERVSLSPVEARAQMNATFEAFWNADRPTLWAVCNHEIPGPQGRVRGPSLGRPVPCLIYSHGVGWVIEPISE